MVRAQVWPLQPFDRWLQIQSLRLWIHHLGFQDPVLWLYFPPSFKFLIEALRPTLTCYHCTDDHAGYAEMLGLDAYGVRRAEIELLRSVDVVFTTSRPLYEQKSKHNANTYLMPNVADVGSFIPVARGQVPVAPELRDLPGPVAGFIGAVDAYKVDLPLVGAVAHQLPDWSFLFVGPVGSGDDTKYSDLPSQPNLHFLGPRPYAHLPGYVAAFDVCTLPYRLNSYTRGVFPLKFWEYLASGKPVVTAPLPALSEYYEYVEVAKDARTFVGGLQRAYASARDEAATEQRLQLAIEQSWETRAAEMLDVLRSHLGPVVP
jgi:glycosyltransferase involved in cell wall biosynthesis